MRIMSIRINYMTDGPKIIVSIQYSIIPRHTFTAKPVISDPRKENGINDWPKRLGFS